MDWLAIASADHVARGLAGDFTQVCHGKSGPLRRIRPRDRVIYYSPSRLFGIRDGYSHFTASGVVSSETPYQADMGGGFMPFRHDVIWDETEAFPIRPLLQELDLTRGKSNWAYPFRFGLLPLSADDGDRIRRAMGVMGPDARRQFARSSASVTEPDLFASSSLP